MFCGLFGSVKCVVLIPDLGFGLCFPSNNSKLCLNEISDMLTACSLYYFFQFRILISSRIRTDCVLFWWKYFLWQCDCHFKRQNECVLLLVFSFWTDWTDDKMLPILKTDVTLFAYFYRKLFRNWWEVKLTNTRINTYKYCFSFFRSDRNSLNQNFHTRIISDLFATHRHLCIISSYMHHMHCIIFIKRFHRILYVIFYSGSPIFK